MTSGKELSAARAAKIERLQHLAESTSGSRFAKHTQFKQKHLVQEVLGIPVSTKTPIFPSPKLTGCGPRKIGGPAKLNGRNDSGSLSEIDKMDGLIGRSDR